MYALASLQAPPLLRGRRGTMCTAKGSDARPGVPLASLWCPLGSAAFVWQAWDNRFCVAGVGQCALPRDVRPPLPNPPPVLLLIRKSPPLTHTHHSLITHTHTHSLSHNHTHSHSQHFTHTPRTTHSHTHSHTHTHWRYSPHHSSPTHPHIASPCHVLARIFGLPAACSLGPRKFDIQDR